MRVSDAPSIVGPADAGLGHNKPPVSVLFVDEHKDLITEVEALAGRANTAKDGLVAGRIANDNERDTWVALGLAAKKVAKQVCDKRDEIVGPIREELNDWNRLFGVNVNPHPESLHARCLRIKNAAESLAGAYADAQRAAAQKAAAEAAAKAREEAQRKLDEAAASAEGVIADVALQEAEKAEHKAKHLEAQALGAATGPVRTDAGTISERKQWDFRIVDIAKVDLNGPLRAHIGIDVIEKAIRAHIRANRNTVPLTGVEIFQSSKAQLR
ncbi:MAG: hypothetical protein M9939_26440 [Mesorhizobium sp.]|nr:hypothetical protein [Mesorhizobium sp.]MCO5085114.1 hypothetical protein [Rhizobiaceae bacterium]MCO5164632.1 hypothetical protein [Mesorhizobium sp.]